MVAFFVFVFELYEYATIFLSNFFPRKMFVCVCVGSDVLRKDKDKTRQDKGTHAKVEGERLQYQSTVQYRG